MNHYIAADDLRYDDVARELIRIGREAIAVEDDEALDAYFAEDFAFHGPDGDLTFAQLKAFFAAMRRAFTNFACERREIVREGSFLGARTTMSGIFQGTFEPSPVGPVEPNGQPMTLELINVFRFDEDGRLAEEWVQYDNLGFLRQLGVELAPLTASGESAA